jgi:hypothetical protein
LASLVSLLAFAGFWIISRGKLDEQRDACRRLAMRIVESRLGKPAKDSATEIVRARSLRKAVATEKSSFIQNQNGNPLGPA